MSMQQIIEQVRSEVVHRGLTMNPCLSEARVSELEAAWGISLPQEYRAFVTLIGNGGEGPPEYGLAPLGTGPSYEHGWNFAENYAQRLRRRFPRKDVWLWGDDESDEEVEAAADGVLFLGDDGCGMYWMLVVTGEARSEVWQLAEDGVQPCAPRLGFLDWYQSWLDGNTDWWRDYGP
jgi:SMI1 / KNR4 family (SUKH-1)